MQNKYYLAFENGILVTRYVSSIHGENIPEDAVEVEEDLFNASIAETEGEWRLAEDGTIAKHEIVLPLETIKQLQIAAINAAFEAALDKGVAVSLGYRVDARLEDLQQIKTSYDVAKLLKETTMTVVDYNNVVHAAVSLSDVEKIMKEAGMNFRKLFLCKQDCRGKIKAATSAKAVQAITWPDN